MSLVSATTITRTLKSYASIDRAKNLSRFFKTGKGQYGEGDKFMGIVVPDVRKVAKEYYKQVTLNTIEQLIRSPYHEVRLCALIMLVYQYQRIKQPSLRGNAVLRQAQDDTALTKQSHLLKKEIYNFYLSHTKHINNWDLVDLTAPNIVGEYLLQNSNVKAQMTNKISSSKLKTTSSKGSSTTRISKLGTRHSDLDPILFKLSKSASLWEHRIAILSTFAFIRAGRHQEVFTIAEILLHDKHDLIHKAVGWMLREVGKRIGKDPLREFLDKHASTMPRTALRYAIEHMEKEERNRYMQR